MMQSTLPPNSVVIGPYKSSFLSYEGHVLLEDNRVKNAEPFQTQHHSWDFNVTNQPDCCALTILNRARTPVLGLQRHE
eukprot:8629195-Pyramimonas_sp.AAC.1